MLSPFCNEVEDFNHIFLDCSFARKVWLEMLCYFVFQFFFFLNGVFHGICIVIERK